MDMDSIYSLGPTVLGLISALAIAGYCWNRMRIASLAILLWIGAAILIGQFPIFPNRYEKHAADWIPFLTFGTLAFAPSALLLIAALRVDKAKTAMADIPSSVLVMTQAYRIGGIFLIMAYLRGDLPAEIGLVSGVLDVLVAISAIALAFYLRRSESRSPRLVIAWAVLSLMDFGWATLMKFASFFGFLELSPAPMMLGNPPLLIISLFALPFGIFISVYVIIRSRKSAGPSATSASPAHTRSPSSSAP